MSSVNGTSSFNNLDQKMAYFKLTFVSPVQREYLCGLCKELLKNPCHVDCCHTHYCQDCIGRMQLANKTCPKCPKRTRFTVFQDQSDLALKEKINKLKVYCPMKNNGCRWIGCLERLDGHLKWGIYKPDPNLCQVLTVKCPGGCSKYIPRGNVKKHLQDTCTRRRYTCPHCKTEDTFDQITTVHFQICHKFPVDCPNGCKMPGLERCRVQEHLNEGCPLRTIVCEFNYVGCQAEFKATEQLDHMTNHMTKHLSMLLEHCHKLDDENMKLKNGYAQLQNECSSLRSLVNSLVGNFQRLENNMAGMKHSLLHPSPSQIYDQPPSGRKIGSRRSSLPTHNEGDDEEQYLTMACARPHKPLKKADSTPIVSQSESTPTARQSQSPPPVPQRRRISSGYESNAAQHGSERGSESGSAYDVLAPKSIPKYPSPKSDSEYSDPNSDEEMTDSDSQDEGHGNTIHQTLPPELEQLAQEVNLNAVLSGSDSGSSSHNYSPIIGEDVFVN